MVQTRDLDSWEELAPTIHELQAQTDEGRLGSISKMLFRGQSDSEWNIETTLDRRMGTGVSAQRYFDLVRSVRPEIETFTGQNWEVPDPQECRQWESDSTDFSVPVNIPGYAFWVYLRHHGFPSPLLDWSRSPYIAAYFAYSGQQADRVSIYAYREYAGHGKLSSMGSPTIRGAGRFVRSHRRHFLQQSEYTVCWINVEGKWMFGDHEVVFARGSDAQDLLWKINLPGSEQVKALRELDKYNLNSFSLLQNEEALLQTASFRHLEFED